MKGYRLILGSLALLGGAFLACQCGGEERFPLEATDPGRPKGQFHDLCVIAASRACEYDGRCSSEWFKLAWFNQQECIERTTLNCELRAEDPSYGITPQSVATCTLPTDEPCAQASGAAAAASAEALVECLLPKPVLSKGSVCFDSATCSTGYCMPQLKPSRLQLWCGTCEPDGCDIPCDRDKGEFCYRDWETRKSYCRTDDPEGTPCGTTSRSCGENTFCIEGFCRRGRQLDETCDPDSPSTAPCFNGDVVYCHPQLRLCQRRAEPGDRCDDAGLTAPPCTWVGHCDRTGYCRKVLYAWYDEVCGVLGDDRTECLGWARCTATRSRPEGRCIRPADDGRLCDPNQRLNCLPPAQCIGGFCRYPKLDYCDPPRPVADPQSIGP